MNKLNFLAKVDEKLTPIESALCTFNLLYNAKHIEYYKMFKLGEYEKCLEYIDNNRDQLTVENIPDQYRDIAITMLKSNNLL